MQRAITTNGTASIRNKLMLACALVMACVLATPAAMAHDYYRGGHGDSGKVLGALVIGAVIGGVIASASQHNHDYYGSGYYYPAQSYPPQGYYQSYPSYPSYPAYSYDNSGYYGYPGYGYGSSVNVGVVYSSGGHRYRDSRGYYGHRSYRDNDRANGYRRGGQGRYYSHRDH